MQKLVNKPLCFGNVSFNVDYLTGKSKCGKCRLKDRCVTESIQRDTRRGMDD